jgi:hypothetical protein
MIKKVKQSVKPKTKINQILRFESGKFVFTAGRYKFSSPVLQEIERYLSDIFDICQDKIHGFEDRLQVDPKLQDEMLKQFWARSANCQSCHNHPSRWSEDDSEPQF